MWIIPNNLSGTYPSVLDTKDLGLESEEFSQASEKSLMWRGKHGPSRTWRTRWKRESYIQHLSTRTLRHSHSDSFVERWTSSLEDSPASLSVLLGAGREQTMNDTSTHSSAQGSGNASQQLSFSKTSPELSAQNSPTEHPFSNMSSKTWKAWVTQQRQESLARKKLAQLIEETGYSSWPTPEAFNMGDGQPYEKLKENLEARRERAKKAIAEGKVKQGSGRGENLAMAVQRDNWPTPRAVDARSANQPRKDRGVKPIAHLNAAVKQENWPTPTTAEAGKIGNQANFGQTGLSNHPAIRGETERGKMLKSREGDGRSTQQNWGTPTSRDWKGSSSGSIIRNDGKSRMDQLVYQVEQPQHGPPAPDTNSTNGKSHGQSWTTPNANDHREATGMRPSRIETNRKTEYLHRQVNTTTGKLNPNWVEQLMGIPVGWTQLSSAWTGSE